MLGALDSAWEREHEAAVKPIAFAMPNLPGIGAPPPPDPGFANKAYAEAHSWFTQKKVVDRATFDELTHQAKLKAFTVANTASQQMLETAHAEVAKQIAKGADFRDFRKAVADRMESAGWTPANPSHVENIFRTNVMGSYNAGRYAEMTQPAVLKARPYWQVLGVNDARTRKSHQRVHGWVFRADDPGWHKCSCPFGYMCRCRVRSLSQSQVDRLGLQVHDWSEVTDLPDEGFESGIDAFLPFTPPKAAPTNDNAGITPGVGGRPMPVPERAPLPPPRPYEPYPVPPPAPPKPHPEFIPAVKPVPAPPPPPAAVPSIADAILQTPLSGPKGSNAGGLYRGADGVERYVKFYEDHAQPACEHLANRIYLDLGLAAPESEVFATHSGKPAYASKIIDGVKNLSEKFTDANAKKAMNGFAADVLLGNWDAAGLGLDNMGVAGSKLYRMDNGGSLLFRAKAGRKSLSVLDSIPEWEGFFDAAKNPAYAKLAAKAGVKSAAEIDGIEKQIEKIVKLSKKPGGWAKYVATHAPEMPLADKERVLDMLEARTELLEKKLAEIRAAKEAAKLEPIPTYPTKFSEITEYVDPHTFETLQMSATQVEQASTAARSLPKTHQDAIRDFTGSGYSAMRAADRGAGTQRTRLFNAGVAKLPRLPGTAYRGVGATPSEIEAIAKTGHIEVGAMSSFSRRAKISVERFAIPHAEGEKVPLLIRLVDQNEAVSIESISHFDSEAEVILPKSPTRYRVTAIRKTQWKIGGSGTKDVYVVDAVRTAGTNVSHKLSSRHG